MSASLGVLYKGKRHGVKLTPMQPLSTIVEQIRKLTNEQLTTSACKIFHNKKELDASTPVRFANLPNGVTLELKSGNERALGIQEQGTPAPTQEPATSQSPPSSGPETAAAPNVTNTAPSEPAGPSLSLPVFEPRPNSATTPDAPGGSDPLSLGRHIHVFSRAAAAEEEASRGAGEEPPEEFFEFTADDYQRVVAGQARERARAEAGLRTQKLREDEMRRRAASLGPVPIRVHFPDDTILQASFRALEQVSVLQQLIEKCLLPSIRSSKWQIYTTPPKQVIKDFSATFYVASLVPAANMHFSLARGSTHEGPFLRPEVMALKGSPPEARGLAHKQPSCPNDSQGAQSATAGAAAAGAAAGASTSGVGRASGPDGKKMPKWMKMGGK